METGIRDARLLQERHQLPVGKGADHRRLAYAVDGLDGAEDGTGIDDDPGGCAGGDTCALHGSMAGGVEKDGGMACRWQGEEGGDARKCGYRSPPLQDGSVAMIAWDHGAKSGFRASA